MMLAHAAGVSVPIKAVLAIGAPLGYVSLITAVRGGDLGVSLAVTLPTSGWGA
ncbi:MAG: hypothetical protein ABL963_00415 [Longimicrobiales bacterium]